MNFHAENQIQWEPSQRCFHQWKQKCSHKSEFQIRLFYLEKDACIFTEKVTRSKSDTLDQKQYSSFFPCLLCSPSSLLQAAATSCWLVRFRMLSFSLLLWVSMLRTFQLEIEAQQIFTLKKEMVYSKIKMSIIYSFLFQEKHEGDIWKYFQAAVLQKKKKCSKNVLQMFPLNTFSECSKHPFFKSFKHVFFLVMRMLREHSILNGSVTFECSLDVLKQAVTFKNIP